MLRRAALFAAVIAAAAACMSLAACGGDSEKSSAAGSSPAPYTRPSDLPPVTTPAPTRSSGPALNERGNLVKQLGEDGGVGRTDGGPLVITFAVDAIRVDPKCDAPGAGKPMNGHFIAVDMRFKIDPSVTDGVFLAAKDFAIVGPNGVTDTNVVGYGWDCMRNRLSEQQLRPGQYQGIVVLDAAETSGDLVYQPQWGQTGGWEWHF